MAKSVVKEIIKFKSLKTVTTYNVASFDISVQCVVILEIDQDIHDFTKNVSDFFFLIKTNSIFWSRLGCLGDLVLLPSKVQACCYEENWPDWKPIHPDTIPWQSRFGHPPLKIEVKILLGQFGTLELFCLTVSLTIANHLGMYRVTRKSRYDQLGMYETHYGCTKSTIEVPNP